MTAVFAFGFISIECVLSICIGVCLSIVLLLFGAYICTHVVRMKKCLVWVGIFLFAFGCTVYLCQYGAEDGWAVKCLRAANSSLSAFFASRGGYDVMRNNGGAGVFYWLFHLCIVLYVSAIIMATFGTNFCNVLWVKWCFAKRRFSRRCDGTMNVFWGGSAEAEAMANGLAAEKGNTISTSDDIIFAMPYRKKSWLGLRDDEMIHSIARKRYRWIFASPEAPGSLARAGRHFFLCANGQENVVLAERLLVTLQGHPVKGRHVTVYVRISANADDDILYRWADKWNIVDDTVEVVVVREESLVSRRFLLEHPMFDCPGITKNRDKATVSGEFKVLLIGFGTQGKSLMGEMICDAQSVYSPGRAATVRVDVFDKSASSFGWFKANCPDACSNYNISFFRRNVYSAEFWRDIKSSITIDSYYNRVVVCTRDDRTNISIANDIAKLYREIGVSSNGIVFARVRNRDVNEYLDRALKDDGEEAPFMPFGRMTDTYSANVVLVDKWDRGAMWLNWKWMGQEERPREEVWRQSSFFNKESSRASFFGQRKLLQLIGFDVDYKSDRIEYCKADLTDALLNVLAETEHLRWIAFHFLRGVKTWNLQTALLPARNSKGAQHKIRANRITEINAHAALVPFADLPLVDTLLLQANGQNGINTNLQQIDRDFVLAMVPAMKEAGFGIIRTK